MALKKIENSHLIYISYIRESFKEFEQFKNILANSGSLSENEKDIVIDLTGTSYISSPEIGAIIRLVKRLQGTRRFLHIIATPSIKKVLDSTNVNRIKNLVIYQGQQEFKQKMKAAKKTKDLGCK